MAFSLRNVHFSDEEIFIEKKNHISLYVVTEALLFIYLVVVVVFFFFFGVKQRFE